MVCCKYTFLPSWALAQCRPFCQPWSAVGLAAVADAAVADAAVVVAVDAAAAVLLLRTGKWRIVINVRGQFVVYRLMYGLCVSFCTFPIFYTCISTCTYVFNRKFLFIFVTSFCTPPPRPHRSMN